MGLKDKLWTLREFVRWPYIGLLLLSIALSFVYFISLKYIQNQNLQSWLRGLTSATLASYLTAVLIDKTYRDKEKRETEQAVEVALQELQKPMNAHLILLAEWYAGASAHSDEDLPSTFQKMLSEDFAETASRLDFLATYPTVDPETGTRLEEHDWLKHSVHRIRNFSDSIEQITIKYGRYMDSEMLETFQMLLNSELSSLLSSTKKLRTQVNDKREEQIVRNLAPMLKDQFDEHAQLMIKTLRYFENYDITGLKALESTALHQEQIAPERGSAQLDITIIEENGE